MSLSWRYKSVSAEEFLSGHLLCAQTLPKNTGPQPTPILPGTSQPPKVPHLHSLNLIPGSIILLTQPAQWSVRPVMPMPSFRSFPLCLTLCPAWGSETNWSTALRTLPWVSAGFEVLDGDSFSLPVWISLCPYLPFLKGHLYPLPFPCPQSAAPIPKVENQLSLLPFPMVTPRWLFWVISKAFQGKEE